MHGEPYLRRRVVDDTTKTSATLRNMPISNWFEKDGPIHRWWNSAFAGVPLWLVATALVVLWYAKIPPPGFAIGALAVVAGIMSVRDMKVSGKMVWTLLLICFLFTEFRAIAKDRADNAAELKKQHEELNSQFESVLKAQNEDFRRTMGGISRQIDVATGGKSYAYLTYVPGQGFLAFIHKGEDRIYSTYARIVDIDNMNVNMIGTIVEVGELSKGKATDRPVPPTLLRPMDNVNLNIFFTARNGDWLEQFRARRTKDGWTRLIRVEGAFGTMPKYVTLCQTVDKNFPMETLDSGLANLMRSKAPPCDR